MCSTQWKSTMPMKNCRAGLCQLVLRRSERPIERARLVAAPCRPTASVTSFSFVSCHMAVSGGEDSERGGYVYPDRVRVKIERRLIDVLLGTQRAVTR